MKLNIVTAYFANGDLEPEGVDLTCMGNACRGSVFLDTAASLTGAVHITIAGDADSAIMLELADPVELMALGKFLQHAASVLLVNDTEDDL